MDVKHFYSQAAVTEVGEDIKQLEVVTDLEKIRAEYPIMFQQSNPQVIGDFYQHTVKNAFRDYFNQIFHNSVSVTVQFDEDTNKYRVKVAVPDWFAESIKWDNF